MEYGYSILFSNYNIRMDFFKRDHVIAKHDFHFESHATTRVWLPFKFYS